MRNKTGTPVFWENGVHYPRVFQGAYSLTKKPEDSGYEIGYQPELSIRGAGQEDRSFSPITLEVLWNSACSCVACKTGYCNYSLAFSLKISKFSLFLK